jgi:hypothetical protein
MQIATIWASFNISGVESETLRKNKERASARAEALEIEHRTWGFDV